MTRPKKWTPSWTAWALGTFGFVLAAVFLIRIYIVYQYRDHSGVLQEETLRVGILLDRQIQQIISDVDSWRTKVGVKPQFQKLRYGPPVPHAVAYRVYMDESFRGEWLADGYEKRKIGVEGIVVRDPETRFVSAGADFMALSWRGKDQSKNFLVLERTAFRGIFKIEESLKSRISMLLMNSMNHMLLQSERSLNSESFRGTIQYQYDGRGVVQIQDLGHDVLAFLSIPSAKGLVLMARTSRR